MGAKKKSRKTNSSEYRENVRKDIEKNKQKKRKENQRRYDTNGSGSRVVQRTRGDVKKLNEYKAEKLKSSDFHSTYHVMPERGRSDFDQRQMLIEMLAHKQSNMEIQRAFQQAANFEDPELTKQFIEHNQELFKRTILLQQEQRIQEKQRAITNLEREHKMLALQLGIDEKDMFNEKVLNAEENKYDRLYIGYQTEKNRLETIGKRIQELRNMEAENKNIENELKIKAAQIGIPEKELKDSDLMNERIGHARNDLNKQRANVERITKNQEYLKENMELMNQTKIAQTEFDDKKKEFKDYIQTNLPEEKANEELHMLGVLENAPIELYQKKLQSMVAGIDDLKQKTDSLKRVKTMCEGLIIDQTKLDNLQKEIMAQGKEDPHVAGKIVNLLHKYDGNPEKLNMRAKAEFDLMEQHQKDTQKAYEDMLGRVRELMTEKYEHEKKTEIGHQELKNWLKGSPRLKDRYDDIENNSLEANLELAAGENVYVQGIVDNKRKAIDSAINALKTRINIISGINNIMTVCGPQLENAKGALGALERDVQMMYNRSVLSQLDEMDQRQYLHNVSFAPPQ